MLVLPMITNRDGVDVNVQVREVKVKPHVVSCIVIFSSACCGEDVATRSDLCVCVRVSVCLSLCLCLFVCVCVFLCLSLSACLSVCLYACLSAPICFAGNAHGHEVIAARMAW